MYRFLLFTLFMLKSICYCQIPDSTEVNGEKIVTKLLNEITISPLQLSHIERLSYFRLQKKVKKVYKKYKKSSKIYQNGPKVLYTPSPSGMGYGGAIRKYYIPPSQYTQGSDAIIFCPQLFFFEVLVYKRLRCADRKVLYTCNAIRSEVGFGGKWVAYKCYFFQGTKKMASSLTIF